METGLLVIRVIVGLTLAAHGAQKLSRAFGGHGIAAAGGLFEKLGFRPGRLFATLAGLGEAAGGLALALGVLVPFASAAIVATMLVAIVGVHLEKGFFAQNQGYEYPLILGAVAAGLAFTGPGRLSVDEALGVSLAGARWGLVALALGLVGALPPLAMRASSARRSATT
jgi:putative oxidoreductase